MLRIEGHCQLAPYLGFRTGISKKISRFPHRDSRHEVVVEGRAAPMEERQEAANAGRTLLIVFLVLAGSSYCGESDEQPKAPRPTSTRALTYQHVLAAMPRAPPREPLWKEREHLL